MTTSNTPPKSFWIIGIISLVWYLLGVFNYLSQKLLTAQVLEQLPKDKADYLLAYPSWATAGFALAVWFGLAGSISLLIKKSWARMTFIISLVGTILYSIYTFFLSDGWGVLGAFPMIMLLVVIIFGIYLISYSKKAIEKAWID